MAERLKKNGYFSAAPELKIYGLVGPDDGFHIDAWTSAKINFSENLNFSDTF